MSEAEYKWLMSHQEPIPLVRSLPVVDEWPPSMTDFQRTAAEEMMERLKRPDIDRRVLHLNLPYFR